MRVLVTGVSGRLGPYVVKALEAAGHDLVLSSRREPIAIRTTMGTKRFAPPAGKFVHRAELVVVHSTDCPRPKGLVASSSSPPASSSSTSARPLGRWSP